MKIKYHKIFLRHYKKRILPFLSLQKKFKERIILFESDRNNPLIRNHQLSGDLMGYCAFSINGDIRIVYKYESKDVVLFHDIGSHNQVYK